MKKLITIAVVSVSALMAHGQATNTPTFFTSFQEYFTGFNTNFTWAGEKFDAETGYKQVTGVNAASFANINYHVDDNWEIPVTLQYSGVGSPINGLEGGVGYALINYYDVRVTADLIGGYDFYQSAGVIEPKLEAKKKLTLNTYASIGISLPYYFKHAFNNNPTFWTGIGFSF